MKTLFTALAILLVSTTSVSAQRTFKATEIQQRGEGAVLQFTVVSEANVRGYQIEAGSDASGWQTVAVIPSKGNSVLQVQYSVNLPVAQEASKYYRVRQIMMDYEERYSGLMAMGGSEAVASTVK